MARDGLSNMREPKVLPADLKCCECLQATLKPAQWRWPTLKKTTIEIQTDNDDDDLTQWKGEDIKNDDHNSVRSLGCLCQWGVKGMPSALSCACIMKDCKPCCYCRRVTYAKVCVASGGFSSVLSRWQEWCAPFLFASRVASAAHTMVLVENEMKTMLGMMHSPLRCLCRTRACMRSDVRQCTCDTIELYDSSAGLADNGKHNQSNARHMPEPISSQKRQCTSNLKQEESSPDARNSTAFTPGQVKANCKNLSKDVRGKKRVMSLLWQVAVPCRRVGRRRMGQPRCNQLTKITPEWKRRQRKSNASLRCQLLRRKVHASVTTTDGDTHALPYAARSADKIQARPAKHNARLRCRLLRRKVHASVTTTDGDTRALPYAVRSADKIQARPTKHHARLRCQLLRRKVHASVTTTDGDTHALPYAVRSADEIQARPAKHNARLRCQLLRRKVHASVTTTDGDTHALPYAVRSADKIQARPAKHNARLRCQLLRRKVHASVTTTDGDTHALPYAVRSADKIQARPAKHNARLRCQLLRRKVHASVTTTDGDTHALPYAVRSADKIQARPAKHNARLRCQLLRRKVHASVTTIDGDTHALPYAVRSADKIQARPTKHNASLGCRLLRLQTKLGTPSNKNSDARVDVPTAQCGCSERLTGDNCNDTAACQPSLCKEYRFVGGGLAPASTSPSQSTDSNSASLPVCILCLRDAPDYAPFGFQTTYSAKCASCKRTNCNQCGSWEGGKFFCKWCFDEGITPSVEAMQSWKAAQQTCKTMRQQTETANWDDILFFVLQQTNTPAANCTSDLYFDPKEVVTAICLSHFHDGNFVEQLLAQEWVNTWSGWAEIADDASNAVWEALAERFMRLAMEHMPSSQKTNAQRVRELHEQGLQLKRASAHGVNNCLIDALLLGLLDAGLIPETMSLSQKQRRHLCAACRFFLYSEHGTPPRIHLDAHRDGPRILDFFLRKKWPQDVAVRIWLYNRFDHVDNGLGTDDALRWIDVECATGSTVTRYALHVYNQTGANERGYHFDALLARREAMHQHGSSASSESSSDKTVPTNIRHAAPETSEDQQRLPKRARLLHPSTIVALRVLRQNGWQLHPCSWPTAQNSLLEAMLLALSFHEWISHAYGQLTYAAERQTVCKGFPVAQHESSGDSLEAWRNRLEAAVCFVLKECQGDTQRLTTESLVICIHKGSAVDVMSPAHTIHVGKGAALISSVVRLLEYDHTDHYDALLPVPSTVDNADFELGVEEVQGRLGKGSAAGWNSDKVPHVEQLEEILQRFCDHRGAHIQVNEVDARRMQTAWNDRDATGTILHTLLQAGLMYADAGMHHARRVADQWRGFYTACTQGEGRRLRADVPHVSRPSVEATATSESEQKTNQQKDTNAEAKTEQPPNHQSRGSKRKNKIRRQRAWKLSKQVARLVAGSRLNQGQTMVRPSDVCEKRQQQQK